MKTVLKTIFVVSIACLRLQADSADDTKWTVVSVPPGGGIALSAAPRSKDTICRLSILAVNDGKTTNTFGPFVVWRSAEANSKYLQLTNSIQTLSTSIAEVVRDLPEDSRSTAIINALGEYCWRNDLIFFSGAQRIAYLEKLKEKRSIKESDRIKELIPDLKEEWSDSEWSITFYLVNNLGAVEKHVFSGASKPLTLQKHTEEIVGPAGTVPRLE